MKIKEVRIELELEKDEDGHATILTYNNGMWSTNGPVFPRVNSAMNEVIQLIRGRR